MNTHNVLTEAQQAAVKAIEELREPCKECSQVFDFMDLNTNYLTGEAFCDRCLGVVE